ncbi:Lipopolysaccharide ABC transporter, ATP-binding protein LptB [Dissulfuribacter thermophilus]|uniref:Lipopolysaccharide ABC transporter, ATP-binding protein LptB n=1 Tax=Dissulfuribacter thermophilus TaxID=1156395 RepID=A0A1B9F3N6_9BACT|nr:LPS export ABC transporter ATP-binding protein [Dissulfuribacter thermophilus]OCC14549.1 Lipopolysaccharide ABC transporter, ATP-binding protein LptB [Dissulfuribacter thermophilus]
MLESKDLVKKFKERKVVDKLCVKIKPGTVVGLLGPNGAGKTTSFLMVAGLLRPDSGKVFLDGEDITELPIHKRAQKGITYLPQEPSVFRGLTVMENLEIVFEARGIQGETRKKMAEELLEEFGLSHLASQKASSLSGGERRRVEVARALSTSPKFVLLDEPFAGVDPISVEELQKIITDLKTKGIGIFISDHNVRETLTVCDHAYILNRGQILIEGPPEIIARDERARNIYLGTGFKL